MGTPHEKAAARVRHLARLLDGKFHIPGTKFRFGWDGLIGLIPGADLLTALPALYILFEARRLKMPLPILLGMAANILIDTLVGLVPVLGDILDFAFKSNFRNARLFEKGLKRLNRDGAIDL
ncbi:MAG: DUF4112 domain-containing protein [Opitutales bacterium]